MSNLEIVRDFYERYYFDNDNYPRFSILHQHAYYPLTDYYYLLLSETLDTFLSEFGSPEQQFIDDFKSQAGYENDSDLSNTKVLDAINNRILNSSTLLEENLILTFMQKLTEKQ